MVRLAKQAALLFGLLMAIPAHGQDVQASEESPWESKSVEPEITYLRMATGSSAASSFSIGQKMSLALSNPPGAKPCDEGGACGVENVVVVAAATRGSVVNLRELQFGIYDLALAQDLHGYEAVNGIGSFAAGGADENLRALARIDAHYLYVLTRKGANVRGASDMAGTIVSRGAIGSGMREVTSVWFSATGLRPEDMDLRGVGLDRAITMMESDLMDAVFVMGTPASPAVKELIGEGIARVQSLTAAETARYGRSLGPVRVVHMPATDRQDAWWTIGTDLVLYARAAMPDDMAEAIVRSLWHERNIALIRRGNDYPAIGGYGLLDPDQAIGNLLVPIHDGAMRFYRAAGMLPPDPSEGDGL